MSGPRKHSLLDNIQARFQQQHDERQERVERMQAKREAEIVHSRYLKQHVVDPTQMANAKFVVDQWAKKHGTTVEKHIKQAIRGKGQTPIQRRRQASLGRARHDGLHQHQDSSTSLQQTRRAKGAACVSGTDTGRRSSCARDISESECIVVDNFDESMSLGNCVREFNKQAVVKKHAFERSAAAQGSPLVVRTNKRLTSCDNESQRARDTNQGLNSNPDMIKDEILIEDGDELSIISDDPVTSDPVTFDTVTPVPVTAGLSGTMCCVVNCGADFSTKHGILEHEASFDHSPCNPLLLTRDCLLPPAPLGYACPKCLQVFKTGNDCLEHQKAERDHLAFLPPLGVASYLCPQCLALFPSHHHCESHINQLNHHRAAYPFHGDTGSPASNSPIPVSRPLAEDFLTRCRFVTFSVSCLDCTLVIDSNAEMVQHLKETNHQHWHFIATATLQQVDVFSKYLVSHACSTCDSVMPPPTSDDDIHYCVTDETESVIGQIKNLECQTFRDFVRRCCISFVVSQDVEITNRFPTQNLSSPRMLTMNRKRKRNSDSVCGKEMKVESSPCADKVYITTEHSVCGKAIKVDSSSCADNVYIKIERSNSYALPNRDDKAKLTSQASSSENVKQLSTVQVRKVRASTDHDQSSMENSQVLTADGQFLEWSSVTDQSLIVPANLNKMTNVIFVNLDNWPYFFTKLPLTLPARTFVWGFCGGDGTWREPHSCPVYDHQRRNGQFYLSPPCGHSEDAADFALCLMFGRMDERLDKCVHFTILSGDHGYQELDRQKETNNRTVVLIDPSNIQQWTDYTILYTIISSVGDQ